LKTRRCRGLCLSSVLLTRRFLETTIQNTFYIQFQFDSRLQQQDTANKILAFIKTLSSHPNDPSASINSFPYPSNIGQLEQESIAQADPDNPKPDFASKLLDLFLEVNDRLKVKEKEDTLDDNMKALLTKDKIHLIDTDKAGGAATSQPAIVASNKSKNQQQTKKVPGDDKSTQQMMGSSQYIQELINAPMPNIECDSDDLDELEEIEEEEFIEFSFAPREVFIATTCFVSFIITQSNTFFPRAKLNYF
jgi:hypothetical protein